MTLRLATRGSPLALWQAERVRELLLAAQPAEAVELVVLESHGDRDRARDVAGLGEVGVFTVAIDQAVLERRADAGVHSLKDMTTSGTAGLAWAGCLARGPVEDALVVPARAKATGASSLLLALPGGARVATGSIRRGAMLRHERPDLELVGMRGNVETRLAKLDAGEAEAAILARAGLERLGLGARIGEVLDVRRFVPAAGQGIVGLTCREDDAATRARLWSLTDGDTWQAALAERTTLRLLRGGCNAPVGVHARVTRADTEGVPARAARAGGGGAELSLHARVLSVDGSALIEERANGAASAALELAQELAGRLLARGAAELIAAARS